MTAFEEFGVMPEIAASVDEMGWHLPTDIQSEAIGQILGGGDVLMAAETGSGKTGAFCIPLLQVTWEFLRDLSNPKKGKKDAGGDDQGWKLSINDRGSEFTLLPGALRCQSRHLKDWHGGRTCQGVAGIGKYYFETYVKDEGICRVGVSCGSANLNLGTCKKGYGFGGTGKKSNNRQFDDYGESYGKASVIGCFLDLNNGDISFSKDGKHLGTAFKISQDQKREAFFPTVSLKNSELELNFGDSPFKYPPSNGFIAFSKAESKDVVKNPRAPSSKILTKINNAPLAIIIEPSRELAQQTCNQIKLFKTHMEQPFVKELLVVGGADIKSQIAELKSGIDIVIGTPDEADGLLKSGYENMIVRFHGNIPKMTSDGSRLQMIVCSATLHSFEVKKLAEKLMHFPTWVDLKGQDSVPDTVHHVIMGVHKNDRTGTGITTPEGLSEAAKMLKGEYCVRAIDEHKMDHGIIFCRTKVDCDNLERHFNKIGGGSKNSANPYSCVCLHSDRTPNERTSNLAKFKNKEVKFLICTDVAARGLDIKGLPFMINMTLPDEKSNYVHRIGRVGRAERMGLAISLISTVKEKVWYHGCPKRGKGCYNTNLTSNGGCCIWYNEIQCLADIEEHLGITIQQVSTEIRIKADEFDGKVVYGAKRKELGTGYIGHASELAPTLAELQRLEKKKHKQSF
ncbi:DDX1 [Lepeophtheirus salmonis]|uniref:ATP-dependent RNA helicase n=1 Tax=Lepeophtheirus salmonis TaxID=72036 RepID=A0A7R8CUA4_LEPSM|nr:DDX1 [Lepeophtheirus salmonis]CAF2934861.1 DDX1 [Lepeophtheirus salmonis]